MIHKIVASIKKHEDMITEVIGLLSVIGFVAVLVLFKVVYDAAFIAAK